MGDLEQQVLELELEVLDSYLRLFVSLFFIPVLRKGLISTCFPQNQKLHIENRLLLEKTSDLLGENEELRQRLGLDTLEEKER